MSTGHEERVVPSPAWSADGVSRSPANGASGSPADVPASTGAGASGQVGRTLPPRQAELGRPPGQAELGRPPGQAELAPAPARGRRAILQAALVIGVLMLAVQLWLLTVALDLFLAGRGADGWSVAAFSGLILLGGVITDRLLGRPLPPT